MKTTVLDRLKQHLNSISDEQFKQEWEAIEAMGLGGPSADEFMASFHLGSINAKQTVGVISPNNIREKIVIESGESSYALAA